MSDRCSRLSRRPIRESTGVGSRSNTAAPASSWVVSLGSPRSARDAGRRFRAGGEPVVVSKRERRPFTGQADLMNAEERSVSAESHSPVRPKLSVPLLVPRRASTRATISMAKSDGFRVGWSLMRVRFPGRPTYDNPGPRGQRKAQENHRTVSPRHERTLGAIRGPGGALRPTEGHREASSGRLDHQSRGCPGGQRGSKRVPRG